MSFYTVKAKTTVAVCYRGKQWWFCRVKKIKFSHFSFSQWWKEDLSSTFPSNKATECTSCHMPPCHITVLPLRSLLITAFLTVTSLMPVMMRFKVVRSLGWGPILISAPRAQWTAPLMQIFYWKQWLVARRHWLIVLHFPMRTMGMMRNSAVSLHWLLITGNRIVVSLTRHQCLRGLRGGFHMRNVGKSSWQTGSGAGVNPREHPDRYTSIQCNQCICWLLNH